MVTGAAIVGMRHKTSRRIGDDGADGRAAAPTLNDIAQAVGVSVASVSKVLNKRAGVSEALRQRVLEVVRDLGYPAGAARQRLPVTRVSIATPAKHFSGSLFYEDVFAGVLNELKAQNLEPDVRLLPSVSPQAGTATADLLRGEKPEALILLGIDDPPVIDQVVAVGIPTVIVNGLDRTMRVTSVLPDNRFAGWMATRHLLEAGHTEIVYVDQGHRLSLRRRRDGFLDALEGAGIALDPHRHILDLTEEGVSDGEAARAIDKALADGRLAHVTAFFCSTDVIALGVLQALEGRGLSVPSDCSVIGFDDVPIALHSRPPLTTMRIGRAELGRHGVELLLERILDPDATPKRVAMAVQLIERASVAAPRSAAAPARATAVTAVHTTPPRAPHRGKARRTDG